MTDRHRDYTPHVFGNFGERERDRQTDYTPHDEGKKGWWLSSRSRAHGGGGGGGGEKRGGGGYLHGQGHTEGLYNPDMTDYDCIF